MKKLKNIEEEISDCYSENFSIETFKDFDTIIEEIISDYTLRFKTRFDFYLNSFSGLIFDNSLITNAVHGLYRNQQGKQQRWFHQDVFVKFQGTRPLDLLTNKIIHLKHKIEFLTSFDELYNIIEAISEPINNIGKLTCYDTALRLGMALDLAPSMVYLHSGAEKGYKLLVDENVHNLKINKNIFHRISSHFENLDSKYIEDILCIYKKSFANIKKY